MQERAERVRKASEVRTAGGGEAASEENPEQQRPGSLDMKQVIYFVIVGYWESVEVGALPLGMRHGYGRFEEWHEEGVEAECPAS